MRLFLFLFFISSQIFAEGFCDENGNYYPMAFYDSFHKNELIREKRYLRNKTKRPYIYKIKEHYIDFEYYDEVERYSDFEEIKSNSLNTIYSSKKRKSPYKNQYIFIKGYK